MEGKKSQFLHRFHHGHSRFVPAHTSLLAFGLSCVHKIETRPKTNRIRYRQSTMHAASLLPQAVVDLALLEFTAVVAMPCLPRTTGAHISELDRITNHLSEVLAMAPSRQPLAYRPSQYCHCRPASRESITSALLPEKASREAALQAQLQSQEAAAASHKYGHAADTPSPPWERP